MLTSSTKEGWKPPRLSRQASVQKLHTYIKVALYSAFKALNNRAFYVIVAQTVSVLLAFKHCSRI